ncbi:Sensor protein QseC [Sulfidibacter corallicola]|uniref:histidine kinase n=1 Tax=Sulfidibacter corallicola TaxID=2818388 RepID=A0A8A4TYW8_SULCO|nr:ATP-binding protein [Sulfidibacter corallicola]QTD51715.1 sensor histidine kinase N-terminal domain-containing protein [Sulfidibacter corallicola]
MKRFIPPPWTQSIHGYLTAALLFGAGFLVVVTSLLLDSRIRTFLEDRYDEDLMGRAQTLITLTKEFDEGIELDYAGEFMPEFETPEGGEFFEVWLPDDKLLEGSESLVGRKLNLPHDPVPAPRFGDMELDGTGTCRTVIVSFIPQKEDADVEGQLELGDDHSEVVTLLLARKRGDFDRFLLVIRTWIWGSLAFLLGLIILLVRFVLRRGLAPLDDIRRQVMAIDSEDLTCRIDLNRPVMELNPVVTQLNALLERLEEAVIRERRFTSDVAHELRTPLSELRTLSEVGLRDPNDVAMVSSFLGDVHDISLEMQHLVENLLDLTRCDSGSRVTIPEEIDVTEAIRKAWSRAAIAAAPRNIQLSFMVEDPVRIQSDRIMVEQIFQNLLNNAVTHSPPGSTVRVELTAGDSGTEVVVTNPAPQLDSVDLRQMFDRFWQKDSARTGGKNTGLGLAIVSSFTKILEIQVSTRLVNQNFSLSLFFPRP